MLQGWKNFLRKITITSAKRLEDIKDGIAYILSDTPLDIVNEWEGTSYEGSFWELVEPREKGPAKGSRRIGAANMLYANQYIAEECGLIERTTEELLDEGEEEGTDIAFEVLKEVLEDLEIRKIIRKIPDVVRSEFKVIESGE